MDFKRIFNNFKLYLHQDLLQRYKMHTYTVMHSLLFLFFVAQL